MILKIIMTLCWLLLQQEVSFLLCVFGIEEPEKEIKKKRNNNRIKIEDIES